MDLFLFNSLTGKKEKFESLEEGKVSMYVCGPTVYDRPHLGNARAVVVYDVLFRLLRSIYGNENVKFVRNITDVDDKINAAAVENKETIKALTDRVTKWFHDDMGALNNLAPTVEPTATGHIKQIIKLIEEIIKNGHAYEAEGHVLLDVKSLEKIKGYQYGCLSGKIQEDLIAGARVEVESYKRNSSDFVLWKPAKKEDDASSKFESPWGVGRPGWHIECSAMSQTHLGKNFDIHGGGADLKFPHHENEIAQSKAAAYGSYYAKYWIHNGFLTVNGEKMSKSLGNFTTVRDLLDKGVKGEVIRLALLSAHYRKPLDFSDKLIEDAEKTLDKFYNAIKIVDEHKNIQVPAEAKDPNITEKLGERSKNAYYDFLHALHDDMNTSLAISHIYTIIKGIRSLNSDDESLQYFKEACDMLGICQMDYEEWFKDKSSKLKGLDNALIEAKISERIEAKTNKDFAKADSIRKELEAMGIILKDSKDGTTWEVK
jgi:cysteinyl-tRNA synthetase